MSLAIVRLRPELRHADFRAWRHLRYPGYRECRADCRVRRTIEPGQPHGAGRARRAAVASDMTYSDTQRFPPDIQVAVPARFLESNVTAPAPKMQRDVNKSGTLGLPRNCSCARRGNCDLPSCPCRLRDPGVLRSRGLCFFQL